VGGIDFSQGVAGIARDIFANAVVAPEPSTIGCWRRLLVFPVLLSRANGGRPRCNREEYWRWLFYMPAAVHGCQSGRSLQVTAAIGATEI